MMEYFSDIFLGAAAIAAAVYCLILSRKLARLRELDQDLGGAIAVLSKQVDDMTKVLETTRASADQSSSELSEVVQRAEAATEKLDLLFASMHDLPTEPEPTFASAQKPVDVASPEEKPLFARRAQAAAGGGA